MERQLRTLKALKESKELMGVLGRNAAVAITVKFRKQEINDHNKNY